MSEREENLEKDFLDIADLKEMNISKLTQIAKDLDVPLVAMLDGRDPRERRQAHPFLAGGMGDDRHLGRARPADDWAG